MLVALCCLVLAKKCQEINRPLYTHLLIIFYVAGRIERQFHGQVCSRSHQSHTNHDALCNHLLDGQLRASIPNVSNNIFLSSPSAHHEHRLVDVCKSCLILSVQYICLWDGNRVIWNHETISSFSASSNNINSNSPVLLS